MEMDDIISRALIYIEKHLELPISLSSVADYAGYSQYYFARKFKERMGIGVMEYVQKRRLKKAADAIIGGSRIIDAAFQYGWDSHAGFTKAFKAEYGFSPLMLKMMRSHLDYLDLNDPDLNYLDFDFGEEKNMEREFSENKQTFYSKEELYQQLAGVLSGSCEDYAPLELEKVYSYACTVYRGIYRYSGEEYITHPLQVAMILAELNAPVELVYAGMFCDARKKTGISREQLEKVLPEATADLVWRLADFQISTDYAELDEDAALIKLAERLHNMRTVQYLDEPAKRRRAQETVRFFVPLAKRLNHRGIMRELDELCFFT